MEFLDHSDLASMRRTSMGFKHLADDEKLWAALLNRKYITVQSGEQSQKSKFISRYKRIKWNELSCEMLQDQIKQIVKTYKRYSCQGPSDDILFKLICNVEEDDDEEVDDRVSDINCLTGVDIQKTIRSISFSAVVFFVENFPLRMDRFLFCKWNIWNGNDLFGILLWASQHRLLSVAKLATRALDGVFAYFSHERLLSYISKSDTYTMITSDQTQRYTTSCFRRLVYEGAFKTLEKVIKRFGPESFIEEIRRVDEIGYTILNDLTAEKASRGDMDINMLNVLYNYFSDELHGLVRRYITRPTSPNCLFSISECTNTAYIEHFLRYFREEARQFVNWCETDATTPMVHNKSYVFHVVYAFCKARCY